MAGLKFTHILTQKSDVRVIQRPGNPYRQGGGFPIRAKDLNMTGTHVPRVRGLEKNITMGPKWVPLKMK